MDCNDFISDLQSRGIAIWVEGGSIKVRPASQLTTKDDVLIRDHKPALVALLSLPRCRDCRHCDPSLIASPYDSSQIGYCTAQQWLVCLDRRRSCSHFQAQEVQS